MWYCNRYNSKAPLLRPPNNETALILRPPHDPNSRFQFIWVSLLKLLLLILAELFQLCWFFKIVNNWMYKKNRPHICFCFSLTYLVWLHNLYRLMLLPLENDIWYISVHLRGDSNNHFLSFTPWIVLNSMYNIGL